MIELLDCENPKPGYYEVDLSLEKALALKLKLSKVPLIEETGSKIEFVRARFPFRVKGGIKISYSVVCGCGTPLGVVNYGVQTRYSKSTGRISKHTLRPPSRCPDCLKSFVSENTRSFRLSDESEAQFRNVLKTSGVQFIDPRGYLGETFFDEKLFYRFLCTCGAEFSRRMDHFKKSAFCNKCSTALGQQKMREAQSRRAVSRDPDLFGKLFSEFDSDDTFNVVTSQHLRNKYNRLLLFWNNIMRRLWRNTCCISGARAKTIHHLDAVCSYPERMLSLDNGVCLTPTLHKKFHRRYDPIRGTCTKALFDEFFYDETGRYFSIEEYIDPYFLDKPLTHFFSHRDLMHASYKKIYKIEPEYSGF